jgi:3-oxoacyl-[acyl-carrier-protein] synthase III
MAIQIIATGHYVPEKKVTNDDLSKLIDTTDEWIRTHTGIRERHIADKNQASSDLAYEAAMEALRALDSINVQKEADSIDLIIVATASPDYPGFPSVACIVQNRIGASRAAAFDLAAGCTGFVYALETANCMLAAGNKKKALVIGADTLSRITDWTDRNTCVLFGDGAGAVIIEKRDTGAQEKRGIGASILGADGSGADKLILRRGGTRDPFKKGEVVDKIAHIEMDGQAVYLFAVNAVTSVIQRLLADSNIRVDQVKRIIPHQANERIIAAAAKRLGIPLDLFYLNMDKYANTSAASIPIALDELSRSGELNKGDILLTVGFGAGLTYGGNVIVW